MKRQFTILLILFFIFSLAIFLNVAKANDHTVSICSYEVYNVSYQVYENNILWESLKKFIEIFVITPIKFVNENLLGIIFLIWVIISAKRVIHNHDIRKKYKRDDNKYKIKRNKDDGKTKNRNAIYLVCKKKNGEGKIVWHHIINMYTLIELEYAPPSREDNGCLSFVEKDKNYTMGKNIIIHNITFDFRKIDSQFY